MTAGTLVPPLSEAEAALAQESARRLQHLGGKQARSLKLVDDDRAVEAIDLPAPLFRLILDVLDQLGRGNAIAWVPVPPELTTSQAAALLGVSRPCLVELLEKGELPFRTVGCHRRVRFVDLMKYRKEPGARRQESLDELVRLSQELGLYEEGPTEDAGGSPSPERTTWEVLRDSPFVGADVTFDEPQSQREG